MGTPGASLRESEEPDRPAFLFVVDTEGDDEWTRPRLLPSLHNLHALPRFQALCERYGVRPTYVVTHSVATDAPGAALLRAIADAGRAEIGAHLHPWTTPHGRAPTTTRPRTLPSCPIPFWKPNCGR
jgi:hypothetical protein